MAIHIESGPTDLTEPPPRALGPALWAGWRLRCPACGTGRIFKRYLKVNDDCPHCGEHLGHHRADDAPPYFTILIVGHVIVGLVLSLEQLFAPPTWVHMALWMPLTVIASLLVLPRVKGALVALQWALYMHGFDPRARAENRE